MSRSSSHRRRDGRARQPRSVDHRLCVKVYTSLLHSGRLRCAAFTSQVDRSLLRVQDYGHAPLHAPTRARADVHTCVCARYHRCTLSAVWVCVYAHAAAAGVAHVMRPRRLCAFASLFSTLIIVDTALTRRMASHLYRFNPPSDSRDATADACVTGHARVPVRCARSCDHMRVRRDADAKREMLANASCEAAPAVPTPGVLN